MTLVWKGPNWSETWVEGHARLVAVPGVDVAHRLAVAADAEELTVGARAGAVAPGGGQRQGAVCLD
jgi:hypothetical protein